jgi:hypothetical protein
MRLVFQTFDVITAENIEVMEFWIIAPYDLVDRYQYFEGTLASNFRVQIYTEDESGRFPKTLVPPYQNIWR